MFWSGPIFFNSREGRIGIGVTSTGTVTQLARGIFDIRIF